MFATNVNMEHTGIMKNTHKKNIVKMLAKTSTLRSSDLKKMNIPRVVLTRMINTGMLERVARGLYRKINTLLSEKENLVTIAKKTPNAVFCLLTALYFHKLGTQLPREIWIAMPKGSHTPIIDYPPIKMVQLTGRVYSDGIQTVISDKVALKIYSPAKTVIDCFKFRNKIGLDVALEALKDVLQKKKATIDELFYFAKIERVNKIIMPYLEAMQ